MNVAIEPTKKSYILTDPRVFESLDFALSVAARRPEVTYQTEDSEGYNTDDDGEEFAFENSPTRVHLWRVVFVGPRCPICGLSEGTTHPGAPDPRKSGGAEHICWQCAETFKLFIKCAQLGTSLADERKYTFMVYPSSSIAVK